MDSGVRDSKVNPIGDLAEAKTEKVINNGCDEKVPLLVPVAGVCKEKVKPKKKMKVHWSDINGNKLVEILEFLPSDSDDDESNACFCTIM